MGYSRARPMLPRNPRLSKKVKPPRGPSRSPVGANRFVYSVGGGLFFQLRRGLNHRCESSVGLLRLLLPQTKSTLMRVFISCLVSCLSGSPGDSCPIFNQGRFQRVKILFEGREAGRPKSFRRRAMRNFMGGMIPTGRDVSKVVAFPLPRRRRAGFPL